MLTHLLHMFKKKRADKVNTLNKITISRSKILHNYSTLQSLQPTQAIFPVVKSNAYGHGIQQICEILRETDAPYICADSYPEYQVIKNTARKKTLLIGETDLSAYRYIDPRRCTPVVYNIQTLKHLANSGRRRHIHLFLNTGMNREGIQAHDIPYIAEILNGKSRITLDGVMSHFSHADEVDRHFCDVQCDRFKILYSELISHLDNEGAHIIYRHISNSAGMAKIEDEFFTASRSGIALYGYNPLCEKDIYSDRFVDLQPALDIYSSIVAIQDAKVGEHISYGGIYTCDQDTKFATIPFGYTEGLNRKLSNNRVITKASSAIKTLPPRDMEPIPVVGRVCMNLSCLDIGSRDIHIGDQVKVISSDSNDPNTIVAFAEKIDTIHYEILVKLGSKVRREIVE